MAKNNLFELGKIYYIRGRNNEPCITVALAKAGDYYFRGVAFCSAKDIPCKAIGRQIAAQRVARAYRKFHKLTVPGFVSADPINIGSPNTLAFISRYTPEPSDCHEGLFSDKTVVLTYDELTPFEKKLIAKHLQKENN